MKQKALVPLVVMLADVGGRSLATSAVESSEHPLLKFYFSMTLCA